MMTRRMMPMTLVRAGRVDPCCQADAGMRRRQRGALIRAGSAPIAAAIAAPAIRSAWWAATWRRPYREVPRRAPRRAARRRDRPAARESKLIEPIVAAPALQLLAPHPHGPRNRRAVPGHPRRQLPAARHRSGARDALEAHAMPASSGMIHRHRLNRGGHQQVSLTCPLLSSAASQPLGVAVKSTLTPFFDAPRNRGRATRRPARRPTPGRSTPTPHVRMNAEHADSTL